MEKLVRNFAFFLASNIFLIFPLLNAQDITGDWYGVIQTMNSLHVNLHIHKDPGGLKGTMDSPDQGAFDIKMNEITLEEDTLFFRILVIDVTYKGCVNPDYSIIYGDLIQYGHKYLLDFGRKKLINRSDSSLTVIPAYYWKLPTVNLQKITYTGITVVETGIPKVTKMDTSELKILIPGEGIALNPEVFELPELVIEDEYPVNEYDTQFAPIIVRAKQTQPVPAQQMRMKDDASFNIQYLDMEQGLMDGEIWSILEDSKGNIWFGSYLAGICRYDGISLTYYTVKEGLTSNGIRAMIEDRNGNIWIGTDWGLCKYDGNSFAQYPGELFNSVWSLLETRNGNIWVGTQDGAYEKKGDTWTHYTEDEGLTNNMIWSIIEDKSGNLWLGTDHGVSKYDGVSFTHITENEGLIWNRVKSIIEDRYGNLWFGTDVGVSKYDGKSFIQFTINEGLSNTYINCIKEDNNGFLWFGTWGGGVNVYDGKSFTFFTEKEGLSNNCVSSVIGDQKGNIWVGTNKGLSILSPQGDGNYSIISFGTEDGLKDLNFNENSVCLDSRNRLWWGTGDIVTMLDLNTYEINKKPPVIQLNNIQINQQYIDFRALLPGIKEAAQSSTDTITRITMRGLKFSYVAPFYNYPVDLELPHYLNHLTFYFSAIDWSAPKSIRYQYMLEGLDKQWSPLSTETQADYRNIPAGRYTFRVKAVSKANIWSETIEYPFKVLPPWWFRWWAYAIYAIAFILLARYYIRYNISRERIKAEVQIKQVEVEKMQELDQMKSRFFANISHEFRTPLTLLMGPVNDLLKKQDRLKEGDRKLLAIMKRNAGRLQQLINQLLDLSKLETGNLRLEVTEGDLTWFIRTIVLSFLSLAESKQIDYEYDLQDAPALCFFDEDKVEKITTNLISNALKFTPEEGSVMVTLQYSQAKDVASRQYAEIRVKDTGPGIPEDEKEKIFDRFYQVSSSDTRDHEGSGIGLALTRELVELYRGEIQVESEPGKGSTFTVRLPVSREHFREGEIVVVAEKLPETKLPDDQVILVREAAEPKDTVQGIDTDRPVILIVEDNTDLRKYISGNLFKDYRILEAENGREGLRIAIENIPDLVISDLMMPEMDGVEMCDRLKKDPRTNHIPLIMLTAKADRDSKLESLEIGADDYIIKPFDADELRVRVKNLIEQRKKLREHYRKEFLADPAGPEIPVPEDEFLARVLDCLRKHLAESEFRVEHLGKELGFSRSQLYRKILALTDHKPNEFMRNLRLKMAARMFLEGHRNITRVMYTVGFNTPSYFTRSFRELYGLNPSDYIKQKT